MGNMFGYSSALWRNTQDVSGLLLMALLLAETLFAQGMGSTTRAARRVNIQTDLAPITVNFKDMAVEAVFTA